MPDFCALQKPKLNIKTVSKTDFKNKTVVPLFEPIS